MYIFSMSIVHNNQNMKIQNKLRLEQPIDHSLHYSSTKSGHLLVKIKLPNNVIERYVSFSRREKIRSIDADDDDHHHP